MTRFKMMWLTFKFLMRDEVIQCLVIMMINGIFYSFLASSVSLIEASDIVDSIVGYMYIYVIPAHMFWPRTIEAEVIPMY